MLEAGRIHWKITATEDGHAIMVVEFDGVKACGGGSSGTKNIASWQLVLRSVDDSFDVVISYAQGDAGVHTIGFQDWNGKEGQMMCHGEGDTKCFKHRTTYRVTRVRPSYSCHQSGVCATAAIGAQGGGPAGTTTSEPRYAACECPECFSGDGLSACMPSPCSQTAEAATTDTADMADTYGDFSFVQLLISAIATLLVGFGANTICHRWNRCPMYRPKVVRVDVQQQSPQLPSQQDPVVLGTIVGHPPLPVRASVVPADGPSRYAAPPGVEEHSGDRRGFNPLVTMARVVGGADSTSDAEKMKGQQHDGAWVSGGAVDGGGDSRGGGGGAGPAARMEP